MGDEDWRLGDTVGGGIREVDRIPAAVGAEVTIHCWFFPTPGLMVHSDSQAFLASRFFAG